MRYHLSTLFSLLLCGVLLLGCEDLARLKSIKRIALIECSFDQRFLIDDGRSRLSYRTAVWDDQNLPHQKQIDIQDKVQFFDQVTDRWLDFLMNKTSYQIRVPNRQHPKIQEVMANINQSTDQQSNTVFEGLRLPKSKADILALCEHLNVEAVMGVHTRFIIGFTPTLENDTFRYEETDHESQYWGRFVKEGEPTEAQMLAFIKIMGCDGQVILDRPVSTTVSTHKVRVVMSEVLAIKATESAWFQTLLDQYFLSLEVIFE